MTNMTLLRFLSFTLALELVACADEVPNPDAHVDRDTVLIAPGATYRVPVSDVVNRGGLRLRADRDIVEVSIEAHEALFGATTKIAFTGRDVGTTVVELLDGDVLLDTLSVEVAPVDHLALAPGQNALDDIYPAVVEPFGMLVAHRVVVQATARASDGRAFDTPGDWEVTLEAGADVDVSVVSSPYFRVEIASPGTHALTLVSENGARRAVDLVAVDANAIVALELETSEYEAEIVTFSVVGLTADGRRIIGLDPELTVDGVGLESSIGRWIFERPGPLSDDAVVTATWQGLSVTR